MKNYEIAPQKYPEFLIATVSTLLITILLANFIDIWAIIPGVASGYVIYRSLPDSGAGTANQHLADIPNRKKAWIMTKGLFLVISMIIITLVSFIIFPLVPVFAYVTYKLPRSYWTTETVDWRIKNLPSRKKIEQQLQKVESIDPEKRMEAVSFVTPDDVADALLILGLNIKEFKADQLNHIAYVISAGIQLPDDAQQILAQLERIETEENPSELVYDRLFSLYNAAQLGKAGKLGKLLRLGGIKKASQNRGAIAAMLSMIGVSAGTAAQSVEGLEGLEEEELVGKDVTARMLAMGTAETFSRLVPPPREYHGQLISIINNADERADTRGSAAVVLGGIGREYPDLSERIAEEIKPLISDKSRECRLLAVEALAGPAVHNQAAADILEAIVRGEEREFALDNALQQKAQAILNGKDTYSYQPSDDSGRSNGGSDKDDNLEI